MSEGITGAAESTGTSAPAAAPTSVDAALESSYDSFASSLAAETAAPDAPETPAVETPGDPPTTEAAPQAEDAPVAPTEGKEGPIPFQVHHKALENARLKAAQETEARLVQEWQTQVQPVMSAAKAIATDLNTSSIDGFIQLVEEYEQHPVLGPQVRSLWGRKLGQQRGQQPVPQTTPPQADEPEPQPDYEYQGTPFYSAPQLQKWQQWNGRQTEARLQQQLQPMQQHVQQQQAVRAHAELRQTKLNEANALYSEYASDPDFVEHQQLVAQRMTANPKLSMEKAWNQVLKDVVMPKKVQQQQQSWVQAAAKKSAGSTVDPSASAPAQQKRPRTVDEGLDQIYGQLERGR